MKITGHLDTIIFYNEQNDYAVFSLRYNNEIEIDTKFQSGCGNITCCGNMSRNLLQVGIPLVMDGTFVPYKKDYSFKFSNISENIDDRENMIQYLSSGTFSGIGPKKASKIVDEFGLTLFEDIKKEDAYNRLNKVLIKEKLTQATYKTLLEVSEQKELIEYITKCGGSIANAIKLYNLYGKDAKNRLEENPYLAKILFDFDFSFCDKLAKNINGDYLSKDRIRTILLEALSLNEKTGNTCCDFNTLYGLCEKVEKTGAYTEKIPKMLFMTQIQNFDSTIYNKDEDKYMIYRTSKHKEELNIARHLERLRKTTQIYPYTDDYIKDAEKNMAMFFFAEQRLSFQMLSDSQPCILTGGPGRGKTTLIKAFLDIYEKMFGKDAKICLCAPTGRASQKLSEATKRPAYTMHKVLEIKPFTNDYGMTNYTFKDASNPIDADLIVIDEFSMVDTFLFSTFLSAVRDGTKIILVGDENQLPSVGSGNLLHDIIDAKFVPAYRLQSIFRQKIDSTIIQNSDCILEGDVNLQFGDDFRLIKCKSEEEMAERVKKLYLSLYDAHNIYDTQILSTTRKGVCGTNMINKAIQETLHDKNRSGLRNFRCGDKIMTERNNYNADGEGKAYYNGDMGTIIDVDNKSIYLALDTGFEHNNFEINKENIDDVSLAYAITVHKAQGSEYNNIILMLPKNPSILLNKNILYTAVTRAKENVFIFYIDDALTTAIQKDGKQHRLTGLKNKLWQTKLARKNPLKHKYAV